MPFTTVLRPVSSCPGLQSDVEGVRMFVGFALLRGVYFLVLLIAIVVLLLVHWTGNWH